MGRASSNACGKRTVIACEFLAVAAVVLRSIETAAVAENSLRRVCVSSNDKISWCSSGWADQLMSGKRDYAEKLGLHG